MSRLDFAAKIPSGYEPQTFSDIIRTICGGVNPLIGGNVASKYRPQSSVPSGGSVSYAVSDFIPDSNATVTNGSVRLGWVCTVSGTPGTFQEVRALTANFGPLTNSLSGDVSLNSTTTYFDGPSLAQGTSGTWFVSGTVSLTDSAGSARYDVKLWDGTNVIASALTNSSGATGLTTVSLSGYISSPVGNIRISVKDISSANGKILANTTGNGKDSTLTAIRIG